MKFMKETKNGVEHLKGNSRGHEVMIWQYPKTVLIEVDGKVVELNRIKLKQFLNRKAKQ